MKTVAVIGNPNVGKTVIFNLLTGLKQRVANWPGVTIEKKEGKLIHNDLQIKVVDLPGTYALSSEAIDSRISRNFIIENKPDLVIDILDSSNLLRNLNLTLQLIELEIPLILVLNKMDLAKSKHMNIDIKKLSEILGVPVIETIATNNTGIEKLKDEIITNIKNPKKPKLLEYPSLEKYTKSLTKVLPKKTQRQEIFYLLENEVLINGSKPSSAAQKVLDKVSEDIPKHKELLVPDARYNQISNIISQVFNKGYLKSTISEKIDSIVLNRFLALPLFLLALWATFHFSFTLSAPFMDLIDAFFANFGSWLGTYITSPWFNSLIIEGIIGGLGFVLIFVPPIAFMFFAISWLEGSGYLPRAAFFMDKFMAKVGLHGGSFIPMIMGLGCNVPAIMTARSIENKKDRLITILINPLISCSARLPVYMLFAGAFFPNSEGLVILSLYLLGALLAFGMAFVFRRTIFKGEPDPFVLELPDYQLPKIQNVLLETWQQVAEFLKKASTLLLMGIMLIWFLNTHPWGVSLEQSYSAQIGKLLEPIFKPLGFDWKFNVALIAGFLAKDMVVGTFGTLYGVGEANLSTLLTQSMSTVTAYAFMVFVLIYTPCLAVLGIIRKETGSWKWTGFSVLYSFILAYAMALTVKVIGSLLI